MPNHWIVGNKTGTGGYGTTNDIAIIWPPNCSPIIVTIYFSKNKKQTVAQDKVIASATRISINKFPENDLCIRSVIKSLEVTH